MARLDVPSDNVSDQSSQFLLQPLSARAPGRYQPPHSENDTKGALTDQQSLTSGRTREHDDPSKDMGILIRPVPSPLDTEKDHSSKGKSNVFVAWSLELLLLLLAYGLLAAIFIILKKYDKEEQPHWGSSKERTLEDGENNSGLTLNTLIAILATIFRAVIAFVAFEILAQLKWDWVSVCFRPMGDLQLFDNASRGVYGSLRLLPVLALRQPLALGAIAVAVTSIGIGPLTQQSIQTYQCRRPSTQVATITVANNIVEPKVISSTSLGYVPHIGIRAAMHDAIVNPSTGTNIASLFKCPSGDCNFTTYADSPGQPPEERISHSGVGMCSRCADIYKLVEGPFIDPEWGPGTHRPASMFNISINTELKDNPIPRIVLEEGFTRIYMSVYESKDYAWARHALPKDFVNAARLAVTNFSVLAVSQDHCDKLPNGTMSCPHFYDRPKGFDNLTFQDTLAWGEPTDYVAAACTVYPCIKHYSATVENSTLFEKTVREVPLHQQRNGVLLNPGGDSTYSVAGVQEPCMVNGTLYTSSNMSSSEKLGPNKTVTVLVPSKDWAKKDLYAPGAYRNVTAPLECVFRLPQFVVRAFRDEMRNSFNVKCLPAQLINNVQCGSDTDDTDIMGWPLGALLRDKSTSVDTITENIESMALRITAELRRVGSNAHGGEASKVEGQAWRTTLCISVTWSWLAIPTAALALSTVLLAWVIAKDLLAGNSGLTWKSSVLPFLLKEQPGLEMMGLKGVEETAKGFEVMVKR